MKKDVKVKRQGRKRQKVITNKKMQKQKMEDKDSSSLTKEL